MDDSFLRPQLVHRNCMKEITFKQAVIGESMNWLMELQNTLCNEEKIEIEKSFYVVNEYSILDGLQATANVGLKVTSTNFYGETISIPYSLLFFVHFLSLIQEH